MDNLTKGLKVLLERWIQRGALHQLLFVGGLVAGVAVAGGLVAWSATERFASAPEAIWWSFLRLTDPGYLGDDEGTVLRVVSTVVTVLGYVLFMGSLIAILSQWLAVTLRRLESGLTPISMRGHVVILGWTNRTAEIVLQLLGARGRLRRFLAERGVRVLRVVVLAEAVDAARRLELRAHVGRLWSERQVFLRSGSSLEIEDLERLDLRRAAAIVVPGAEFELGGAELTDARAVKTLLTLRRMLQPVPVEERPTVVAEVFDSDKVEIAEGALTERLEVIASDAVISRLISQSLRHPRLGQVFQELLTEHGGNSLYLRGFPELAGLHPLASGPRFPRAKVLGALRRANGRWVTHLNPDRDFRLRQDDLVVFIARSYEDCGLVEVQTPAADPPEPAPTPSARTAGDHTVLILGWSHKAAAVLAELAATSTERFAVTTVSRIPADERLRALAQVSIDTGRMRIEHVEGDYATVGLLEGLDLERFDCMVFLASSGMRTSEEADARTVLGYVLLKSRLARGARRPEILVELLDPTNARIFAGSEDVMFVSSRILSYLAAHVCLRPELNTVYEALFVTGGSEITLRSAAEYGLLGREATFADVEREARRRGEIGLGILGGGGGAREVHLNPPRDRAWALGPEDGLVVLAECT